MKDLKSIQPDKPFKDLNDMIELLKERNILINDEDFAKMALSHYSYYSLINGQKKAFLKDGEADLYRDGTSFDNLYALYLVESNLNNILLKYILYVEKFLKTKIAYYVSQDFGVVYVFNFNSKKNTDDYLFLSNYKPGQQSNDALYRLKKASGEKQRNEIIDYYIQTKNHLPPWILITNVSFGLTIKWFSILRPTQKDLIVNEFLDCDSLSLEEKKEYLNKAFKLLQLYRNKIAHTGAYKDFSSLPALPKKQAKLLSYECITDQELNDGIGSQRAFGIIVCCMILLNDYHLREQIISDIKYTLTPYLNSFLFGKHIFELLGLPANVFDKLDTLYNHLTNNQ